MPLTRNFLPVALALALLSGVPAMGHHKTTKGAAGDKERLAMDSSVPSVRTSGGTKPRHTARATVEVEIAAPATVVWQVLVDFPRYPAIFKRIESCRVTRREGDLVFTETNLKPHIFVNEPIQHAVNDLGKGPSVLTWHALDGNFKSLDGKWELRPSKSTDGCVASYTLEVDAGGCIPAPLVSFALRSMQKEIVSSVKRSAEHDYQGERVKTSRLPQKPSPREAS